MSGRKKARKLPKYAFANADGMGSYNVTYEPSDGVDRGVTVAYLESLVKEGVSVIRIGAGANPVEVVGSLEGGIVKWTCRPRPVA